MNKDQYEKFIEDQKPSMKKELERIENKRQSVQRIEQREIIMKEKYKASRKCIEERIVHAKSLDRLGPIIAISDMVGFNGMSYKNRNKQPDNIVGPDHSASPTDYDIYYEVRPTEFPGHFQLLTNIHTKKKRALQATFNLDKILYVNKSSTWRTRLKYWYLKTFRGYTICGGDVKQELITQMTKDIQDCVDESIIDDLKNVTPTQKILMKRMKKGLKIRYYTNSKGKICYNKNPDSTDLRSVLYLTLSMRSLYKKGLIKHNEDSSCSLTYE